LLQVLRLYFSRARRGVSFLQSRGVSWSETPPLRMSAPAQALLAIYIFLESPKKIRNTATPVPLKRMLTFNGLHRIISQNILLLSDMSCSHKNNGHFPYYFQIYSYRNLPALVHKFHQINKQTNRFVYMISIIYQGVHQTSEIRQGKQIFREKK
jgi:hypothetical protein